MILTSKADCWSGKPDFCGVGGNVTLFTLLIFSRRSVSLLFVSKVNYSTYRDSKTLIKVTSDIGLFIWFYNLYNP